MLPAPELPLSPIFDARGKEGFIDPSGTVVIAPVFDRVRPFQEGLAAVLVGQKWGFIDARGSVVIAPRWESVSAFSEGLARVVERTEHTYLEDSNYERDLTGYIDRQGTYLIAPIWRRGAGSFHEGLAWALVDWLSDEHTSQPGGFHAGYIDRTGSWALRSDFHGAEDFSSGLGLVFHYNPGGERVPLLVNAKGATLALPPGWTVVSRFSEGLAVVKHETPRRMGAVDSAGKLVFSLEADDLAPFSGGLAVVRIGDLFGFVSTHGAVTLPAAYRCAEAFSENLARVCEGDKGEERLIDTTGRVVLAGGEGSAVGPFHGGLQYRLLHTRTIGESPTFRNIYGYRNRDGKYVWISPGAESFFPAAFFRERYIGPPRASAAP